MTRITRRLISKSTATRRSFLKGTGLTLAGLSMTSLLPAGLIRPALAEGLAGNKRLLFIFQRGANDGLNTIIPHGDGDYNDTNRPSLYIAPEDAIDLGDGFASFHPSLADLNDLWTAGQLAAIHRVGYPNMSRSHFDSQRLWENGTATETHFFEGWLYRYIQENGLSVGADLPAITVQARPPLLITGQEKFVNVANPDNFDYLHGPPKRDKYQSAWRRIFGNLSGLEHYRPALGDTGLKLVDTLDTYRSWDQGNWHPKDPDTGDYLFPVDADTDPSGRFDGNAYDFFRSLKVCSLSLLEGGTGIADTTRVAGTELGGWDHHDGQGQMTGIHATLLETLAYGMKSLHIVLSGAADEPRGYSSIWDDTLVVVMTEFGRTSKENGSAGTDHGQAASLFAAGGSVLGQVYNCDATTWPAGSMFEIENRYLSHLTDFRAIFWEILRDHMGADPATVDTIFPDYSSLGLTELGFVG